MDPIADVLIQTLSPLVEFAYLIGSAGTERFTSESDIDVAVFWRADVTVQAQALAHQDLIDQFARDVDLVNLDDVDEIFAMQVLDKGRLIIDQNKGLLLHWKVEKMGRYPDFKFSRKIIEDQILKRKKYV